ncbi:MAG: HAMP domain-containing histidine kinase [Bacteroidetes bacterium]|nr:MAG: HAMP domain-containing histidine kinase [Bacteroidota bacterium]
MSKIFLKIFIGFLILIVALTTLFIVFSYYSVREQYLETLTNHLKNLNYLLKSKIVQDVENKNYSVLDYYIKKLGKNIEARITVILPDGLVIADSERDPSKMENHGTRTEIVQAINNGFGSSLRYSHTIHEDMLYVALPIMKEGKIIAVSRVSMHTKDIDKLYSQLRNSIVTIAILLTLLSLIGILLFSLSFTKPIKSLVESSKRISSGDFDTKLFLKRNDELKVLADSFNEMTTKLSASFKEIKEQKEELSQLIAGLQEGLIVIDKLGKITLSNKSFERIIGKANILGVDYWTVLQDTKVAKLIKQLKSQFRSITKEIRVDDGYFLCSGSYIEPKEEIILIFYNITDRKNLELVKKDFISNASHELRTPLTSIKGYVETLQTEIDEKHKPFLDIIEKNTDRIIRIVEDLTILSELEEKKQEPEFQEVNLIDISKNIIKIFEQSASAKGLILQFNYDENLPPIKADSFKIEQLLINLIDNAIKYTNEGTIQLNITNEVEEGSQPSPKDNVNNNIIIEISDTGIGIPKEHQSRIFERFYTVDKSRSKKLGGTGLGLSIVKHIVQLHNGEIKVESELGKGTRFIVLLPVS